MNIDFLLNLSSLSNLFTMPLGIIMESIIITNIVIGVSLSVISMGVSYGLQRFMQKPVKAGERNFEIQLTDTKTYIPIVYGTTRIGSERIYAKGVGKDSKLLYAVLSVCMGEIDGFEGIWLDDKRIIDYTEYGSEEHDSTDAQAAIDHEWKNKVHFWFRRGNDNHNIVQVLQDAVGEEEWDDNAKGLGIAYVVVELGFDLDLFSTGLPDFLFKIRGKRIYDPRDGTQSGTDKTTWKYKRDANYRQGENPSLCILDYLCGGLQDDGSVKYGLGADITTEVDTASFIAAANYCDEIITIGTIDPPTACEVALVNTKRAKTYTSSQDSGITKITLPETPREDTVKIKAVLVEGEGNPSYMQLYEETHYTISGNVISFTESPYNWTEGQKFNVEYSISVGGYLDENKYYRYAITFGTASGETTGGSKSKSIKTTSKVKKIKLTDIPIAKAEDVTRRRIYRSIKSTGATPTWGTYQFLYEIPNNTSTTYTDDGSISLGDTIPSTNTATVTSRRYTCNGIVDNSQELMHNIEQLETSCRGKVVYESGLYSLRIKRATIPETFELTESNIIGDWKWETKGVSNSCNVIEAAYTDPAKKYKTQYVTWPKHAAANVYLGDDNSYELPKKIELPFTDNRKIAKQIAQIIRKESRQMIVASCSCTEEALKLTIYSLVNVTHSTPAWTKKPFWVNQLSLSQEGKLVVGLEEYDATNYDLEDLNSDTLGSADTDLPTPYDIPDQVTNVTFTEISYINKDITYWKLKVSYTNPTSALWKQCDVYVKTGSAKYEYYTTVNKESEGAFYIDNIEEGAEYKIKFLSVSNLGKSNNIDDEDVEVWEHTVDGQLGNPANVSGFIAKVKDSTVTLSWTKATETDFDYYEIRETDSGTDVTDDTSWNAATEVGTSKTNSFIIVNHKGGSFKFWIRAYDKKDNHSVAVGTVATVIEEEESWTSVFTDNFTTGTHDGTEYSDSLGRILRMQQNSIENGDFASSDMSAWNLGTSWQRLEVDGDYCIRVAGGGSYTVESVNTVSVSDGKTYLAKAWVKCNVANAAKLGLNLDGTTVYSNTHSGGGNWELLSVIRTCGTPIGTPVVKCYAGVLYTHSQYAAFDDVGFAQCNGTYRTAYYDNGTSANVTKVYKLDARYPHTNPGSPAVPGMVFVELGICQHGADPTNLNNWTWYPGLESGNVTATGRYRRFRVTFVNVWVNEQLYVQEYAGGVVTLYDADEPTVVSEWTEDEGAALIYPNTLDTKISVGSTSALASVYVKEYSGQSVPLGRWDTAAGTEVASVSNTGLIKTSYGMQSNTGFNLTVRTGAENGRKISFLTGSLGTERAYIDDSTFYINSDLTVTGTFNIGAVLFATIMSPSGGNMVIKTFTNEASHKISFETGNPSAERVYINDSGMRVNGFLSINGSLYTPDGVDLVIKPYNQALRKISFQTQDTERAYIDDDFIVAIKPVTGASGADLTIQTYSGEASHKISFNTNNTERMYINDDAIIAIKPVTGNTGADLTIRTYPNQASHKIIFKTDNGERLNITDTLIITHHPIISHAGTDLVLEAYNFSGGKISLKAGGTERFYISDTATTFLTAANFDSNINVGGHITGVEGHSFNISTYAADDTLSISFNVNSSTKGYFSNAGLILNAALRLNSTVLTTNASSQDLTLQPYTEAGRKIYLKTNATERVRIEDTLVYITGNTTISGNLDVIGAFALAIVSAPTGQNLMVRTFGSESGHNIEFWTAGVRRAYINDNATRIEQNLNLNGYLNSPSTVDVDIRTWPETGRKIKFQNWDVGSSALVEKLTIAEDYISTKIPIASMSGQDLTLQTFEGQVGNQIVFRTTSTARAYITDAGMTLNGQLKITGSITTLSSGQNLVLKPYTEGGRKISFETNNTERMYIDDNQVYIPGVLSVGSFSVSSLSLGTISTPPAADLTIMTSWPDTGRTIWFKINNTERAYINNSGMRVNGVLSINGSIYTPTGVDLVLKPFNENSRKISFQIKDVERMYLDEYSFNVNVPTIFTSSFTVAAVYSNFVTSVWGTNLTLKTADGESGRKISFTVNSTERVYIDENGIKMNSNISSASGVNLIIKTPDGDSGRRISFYQNSSERAYIDNSNFRINQNITINGALYSASGLDLVLRAPDGESGRKISFVVNYYEKARIDNNGFYAPTFSTSTIISPTYTSSSGNSVTIKTPDGESGRIIYFNTNTTVRLTVTDSETISYSDFRLSGSKLKNFSGAASYPIDIVGDIKATGVGYFDTFDITGNKIRIRGGNTPASAGASGLTGQICWDSMFLYVCVNTNTWRRAAILPW